MNLRKTISLAVLAAFLLSIMPSAVLTGMAEPAVYDREGYTLAESTLVVYPKGKSIEQGADGGSTSTFFRILEYPKDHVNVIHGRVAVIRYDISEVPADADKVTASIAMNYHQATGYGNSWFDNTCEVGVYRLDDTNMKWNWNVNGSSRTITYNDIFVTAPADSVEARSSSTLIDTISFPSEVSEVTFSHSSLMANGARIEADITDCVKEVKESAPDTKYINLMFGIDSFDSSNPDIASNSTFSLYFRGEKYVGGSNYSNYDEFRPRVSWYSKRKSEINTLETLEVENGILSEDFNPDATDEGEELKKTYKIGVIDEEKDVELSYTLKSDLSFVSGEVTVGNMNGERNLTIPVTSEAGVTRYYNFELVSASELGYTKDGKFSLDALSYDSDKISGSSVNLNAKLMNNSLGEKDAARVTLFIKDNKLIDSEVEIYSGLGFGPVDEISEVITVGEADTIVSWFADASEGVALSDIIHPIERVAVVSSKDEPSFEKSDKEISISYPEVTESEVIISGKGKASSGVTVFVLEKGKNINDFDYNNASFEDYFVYAGGVNTDEEGYFGINCIIEESGEYTVIASDCESNKIIHNISYIGASERLGALNDIYYAESAEALKEMLSLSLTDEERAELENKYIETNGAEGKKNYVKILGLSAEEFAKGVSDERFCELLYEKVSGTTDVSLFSSFFSDSLILAEIWSGKAEDISEYEEIVIFDDYLDLYNTLSEEAKKNVSSVRLAGKNFATFTEVAKAAETEILLEKLSSTENAVELLKLMTDYADELKIKATLEAFEVMESFRKNAVLSSLLDAEAFESVDSFAKAFKENTESIANEKIEFEMKGYDIAEDTLVVCPGNKEISGANGGVPADFYRIWEYPDGHQYKKYGRVGIIRYDISNVPADADSIKVSIGVNYQTATGYGNDWLTRDFELGVYALANEDMKWGWKVDGDSKSIVYSDIFNKVPADSFKIREMATKLGTITAKSDGTGDIEKITSAVTTSLYGNGVRASCDVTDYVNSVRLNNPDEKYITIMFAMDSFVLNEGETSFGIYIRNEHHESNGTDTVDAFRPRVMWYDIMPSKVNTLQSVELSNGIITEKFEPEATDKGETLKKTYKVAVIDETKNVELTYKKSSGKSTVSGEVTSGSLSGVKTLTVPVTSEAGETRTYVFELCPASELGYSKDGKLEIRAFNYDTSTLKPNTLLNLSATLENKSFSKKKAARISIYHKDNKVNNEKFKVYSGLNPGLCDEISVGINTADAEEIVSWIADVSDDGKLYTALIPIGNVITIGKKATFDKKETLADFYYKDVSKPVMTFSGKWHTGNTGVAAYVIKTTQNVEDFDYDFDTFEDFFVYAGAVNTDANGYYGFDAKLSKTGDYKLVLMDEKGKKEEITFYFATPEEKNAALEEIYKDKSDDALKSKLMLSANDEEREQALKDGLIPYNYVKLFALSTAELSGEITEQQLISQLSVLLKESNKPSEFLELYKDAIIIAKLNVGKITDASEFIEKAEVDSGILELYEEMSEVARESILSDKLSGNAFESYEDVAESFEKIVLTEYASEEKNAEALTEILSEYSETFGLTKMNAFNSLNSVNQRAVLKSVIAAQPYSDTDEIKKVFDNKVTELAKNTAGGSAGGGGGGGGSSAGNGSGSSQKIEASGSVVGNENLNADVIENIRVCRFTDLNGYEWAEAAIKSLYEKGVIDGVSESLYNPAGKVKREEFVKMISTLYDGEEKEISFTDVVSGSWYVPYVAKAVNGGIIKGMSETLFGTGMGVTRQDMAVMILRVLKAEEAAGASGFTDDTEISDYAKPAVTALKKLGVVSGTNEGKFNPKAVMTRAEAAVVINNIINLAK